MKKILILLILIAAIFFAFQIMLNTSREVEGDYEVFTVERGEGLLAISEKLEEEGIVKNSYLFTFYILLKGGRTDLKAGTYLFSPVMSISDIADHLIYGKQHSRRITIIEGWNLNDIARYLEEEGIGTKEEFYSLAGRPPRIEDGEIFSGYAGEIEDPFGRGVSLEGFLFPDTYYVPFSATIEDVILVALRNFERKALGNFEFEEDIFDIITLASLIEKEVVLPEDKRLVSGIIRKRIERGMVIQVDATIVYITGKRSTFVSIEETRINSPYNTYLYPGLPEGPISNPGLFSIEAAINPKESDYLYYLSKPTGETVFSRTLMEHNTAKNSYLR